MLGNFAQSPEVPVSEEESRYLQLCEALVRARAERVARRDECFAFIERFVQGLRRYLNVPPDRIRLAPAGGPATAESQSVGAATSLGDDGYWKTGLCLTVGGHVPGAVAVVIALELHIKKKDRNFLFKLMPDAAPLRISGEPDADASHAFEFVFRQLLDSLRSPA